MQAGRFQGPQGSEVGAAQVHLLLGTVHPNKGARGRKGQMSEDRRRDTQGPGVNLMMVTESPAHRGRASKFSSNTSHLMLLTTLRSGGCYPVYYKDPENRKSEDESANRGSRLCLSLTTFASSAYHPRQGQTGWAHGEDAYL